MSEHIGYIRVSSVDQNTERQREGIAVAKRKGIYKGKPINEALREQIREKFDKGMNKRQIAKSLCCPRGIVYKALN